MGGCTIPGLRNHYFSCNTCCEWYWCSNSKYPDCPIGKKIVAIFRQKLLLKKIETPLYIKCSLNFSTIIKDET